MWKRKRKRKRVDRIRVAPARSVALRLGIVYVRDRGVTVMAALSAGFTLDRHRSVHRVELFQGRRERCTYAVEMDMHQIDG